MLSFYDPFTIKNHIRTYGAVVTCERQRDNRQRA